MLVVCGLFLMVKFSCLFTAVAVLVCLRSLLSYYHYYLRHHNYHVVITIVIVIISIRITSSYHYHVTIAFVVIFGGHCSWLAVGVNAKF